MKNLKMNMLENNSYFNILYNFTYLNDILAQFTSFD